jgi:hypothetical protein
VTQVVDHLSSKCEILQSNPCQKKEKKSQWWKPEVVEWLK